jgi:hypothetical protein
MSGGGALTQLVALGAQNAYLTGGSSPMPPMCYGYVCNDQTGKCEPSTQCSSYSTLAECEQSTTCK